MQKRAENCTMLIGIISIKATTANNGGAIGVASLGIAPDAQKSVSGLNPVLTP